MTKAQLEEMDRAMGVDRLNAEKLMPHKLSDGRYVMHVVKPSDLREIERKRGIRR